MGPSSGQHVSYITHPEWIHYTLKILSGLDVQLVYNGTMHLGAGVMQNTPGLLVK